MTSEQITKYQYCQEYMTVLKNKGEELEKVFPAQHFGCGKGQPGIEYILEDINRDVNSCIRGAIREAKEKVQKIIDDI